MLDAFRTSDSRSWRNWQTRTVQVRVGNHGGSNPFDRTTSQQTTLLSKTGFRPVFSCAPLLLLFPKKLTLFGDPDKKRWMSFCFHTKTEGIRTREGMSVIRMSCEHSNSEWSEGDRAGSRGGSLQAKRSRRSEPFDRTSETL